MKNEMESSTKIKREVKMKKEVIVIDDSKSKPPKKHKKHENKRMVRIDKSRENTETLLITQKVQLEKQKFQCIINLTNISEHKEKRCNHSKKSKSKVKHQKNYTSEEERIVPCCLRKRCQAAIHFKCNGIRKPFKETKGVNSWKNTLSSISYEDISSDSSVYSFDDDSKLETLIKRTKDRERKLSKSFYQELVLGTSTPQRVDAATDIGSGTILSDDMDISIHSLETTILEPIFKNISPVYPTSPKMLTKHSPSRTPQNFKFSEEIKTDFAEKLVKPEIKVEAEIYTHTSAAPKCPEPKYTEKIYDSTPLTSAANLMDKGLIVKEENDAISPMRNPGTKYQEKSSAYSPKVTYMNHNYPEQKHTEGNQTFVPKISSVNLNFPGPNYTENVPYSPTMSPAHLLYPEPIHAFKNEMNSSTMSPAHLIYPEPIHAFKNEMNSSTMSPAHLIYPEPIHAFKNEMKSSTMSPAHLIYPEPIHAFQNEMNSPTMNSDSTNAYYPSNIFANIVKFDTFISEIHSPKHNKKSYSKNTEQYSPISSPEDFAYLQNNTAYSPILSPEIPLQLINSGYQKEVCNSHNPENDKIPLIKRENYFLCESNNNNVILNINDETSKHEHCIKHNNNIVNINRNKFKSHLLPNFNENNVENNIFIIKQEP